MKKEAKSLFNKFITTIRLLALKFIALLAIKFDLAGKQHYFSATETVILMHWSGNIDWFSFLVVWLSSCELVEYNPKQTVFVRKQLSLPFGDSVISVEELERGRMGRWIDVLLIVVVNILKSFRDFWNVFLGSRGGPADLVWEEVLVIAIPTFNSTQLDLTPTPRLIRSTENRRFLTAYQTVT